MHRLFLFCLLLQLPFAVTAKPSEKLSGPYLIISKIESPHDLLAGYLPRQYNASLTVSGSIADEMKPVLDTLKIEMPQYSELFDKKEGFRLVITNKEYTAQTRDLISGILNPIDMIGVVLNAVLQYRDLENLLQMQKETSVTEKTEKQNDTLFTTFTMRPSGDRFYYKYDDAGASIRETWLSRLTITIDAKTMLAHRLSVTRHARTFSAEQTGRPDAVATTHTYACGYTTVNQITVPCRLDISINEEPALRITASYRQVEKYILFDTRTIEYQLPGGAGSDLVVRYGEYRFSQLPKTGQPVDASGAYASKLKKAAAHAREVAKALNRGDIQRAVSLLRNIIEYFPQTPQAIEAQKLLSGLPEGL